MKKLLVVAVVLLTTLGVVNVVQAATSRCTSFSCVNRRFDRLYAQNEKMRSQIKQMQNQIDQIEGGGDPRMQECLREIPVSQYLDYLADDGVSSITGLDLDDGANPDYWVIVDVCYSNPVFPDA